MSRKEGKIDIMIMKNFAKDLYGTVPPSRHMPFYDGEETDLSKVSRFFDLSKDNLKDITGLPKKQLKFQNPKIPKPLKEYIIEIASICELVANNFNGDIEKTALWFRLENPLLGNVSPNFMIKSSLHKELKRFVLDAMDGNLP